MVGDGQRWIWRIVFSVSIVFFAVCSFFIYALRVQLRPFDQTLCGVALAIAVFSVQTLQSISSFEDLKAQQVLKFYELHKRFQVIEEQIERKCGSNTSSVRA
jgi:uncharacterized BrkB/YihY/UPF0761 family membrane protein